jgi:molybdate transport system substrate-binding protein
MKFFTLLLFTCLLLLSSVVHAEKITVAAAADLKFAMDEIVGLYQHLHPADNINVVYGSSGKFYTQIAQGAPYDLYFSADIAFPRGLFEKGFAASEVLPYAIGRIVLWSGNMDATAITLADLAGTKITRIAIANPKHAPYGKRAEEALRASGVWEVVEPKLVYGENIAHAAHFVQSGNAQIGIIALSLAISPTLANNGSYQLISDELHAALEQGFIITRRAVDNTLAWRFADYMRDTPARSVMARYGFVLPQQSNEEQ